MDDDLLDIDPPARDDFRRVGKRVPLVKDPSGSGKDIRYGQPSKRGEILDDDYNLWDWKMRTELVGAAQRPEIMAEVSTLNPDRDKKQLRDLVEKCLEAGRGNQRSVQGTAVHSMFDHVDLEHDWKPAPQFADLVNAYLEVTQGFYGLIPIDVEVRCVNDRYKLAGTLDRRYRTTRTLIAPDGQIIPIGSVIVGDTKTGRTLEYSSGSYATQLAAYVGSVRYDIHTDERSEFDPPNYPDWGLIVHAVPETAVVEMYWVDITAGRQGLELAEQVRAWRRRDDLIQPAPAPSRAQEEPPSAPVSEAVDGEASAQPSEPSEAVSEPEPVAESSSVREWLRGRVLAIRSMDNGAALALQRSWPEGVLGLKSAGHTPEQLDAIALVLDQVEAQFSVPFGVADPRRVESMSRHPSVIPSATVQTISPAISRAILVNLWGAGVTNQKVLEALIVFAGITPENDWSDDDLSTMLTGTLRAMGYLTGLAAVRQLTEEDAAHLISAAFAISSGTAMLLFDAEGKPVVRFNVQTMEKQKGAGK